MGFREHQKNLFTKITSSTAWAHSLQLDMPGSSLAPLVKSTFPRAQLQRLSSSWWAGGAEEAPNPEMGGKREHEVGNEAAGWLPCTPGAHPPWALLHSLTKSAQEGNMLCVLVQTIENRGSSQENYILQPGSCLARCGSERAEVCPAPSSSAWQHQPVVWLRTHLPPSARLLGSVQDKQRALLLCYLKHPPSHANRGPSESRGDEPWWSQ